MGQYYRAYNIDTKQWVSPYNFGPGNSKLMEHSWVGNDFVGAVMSLLSKGGMWYKNHIMWVGDYYGDEGDEIDYYDACEDAKQVCPPDGMPRDEQMVAILVNHTKKLYTRYDEVIANDMWMVNPLPLLTAGGNGRGGGDYYETHPDFDKVGKWAGDSISIEKTVPKSQWYKKLTAGFVEP